jgi:hypothetical protein
LKRRIREITRRAKGVSIKATVGELAPYMRGWRGYFGFCETPEVLIALTRWVRLRLRAALWRQWKTPRRRRAALIALRVAGELCNTAGSGRGPCRPEQSPLHRAFQCPLQIARPAVLDRSALAQLLEPPYTDPYVRWCGRGGAARLPPIPIFGTLEKKNLKTETSAHSRQADASACAEALLQHVTASELHPRLRWAPLPLRRAFVPTYFRLDFGRCHEGKEFRYRHCGASGLDLRSGK